MLMFRVLGTPDEVFCCDIFLWFHALTMCTSSDLLARRHQAPALQPRVPVVEAAPRACRARAGWLRGAAGRADRGVGVHVWGRGRAAAVPPALPPVPRHAAPQSRSPSVGVGDAVAVLGIHCMMSGVTKGVLADNIVIRRCSPLPRLVQTADNFGS